MTDEEVHKGLAGVVADESAVSHVDPESDDLVYRGYPVAQLADRHSFEDVAYLLWEGQLPDADAAQDFAHRERERRELPDELLEVIRRFPADAHPMDALRTGISWLGLQDEDARRPGQPPTSEQALDILAKAPTLMAAVHRLSRGEDAIRPRHDLSLAANLLNMTFGEVPDDTVVDALDASLILYAEHGFNASTFTARVIISTESDLYSAVVGAIGALKGPLHGGANEAVMHMLDEIAEPDRARAWVHEALREERKIMGFGHRVYQHGDHRVPTMKQQLEALAQARDGGRLLEIAGNVEEVMLEEKDLFPNLDFPAGPAYHLMGFETRLFTPIFVVARIAGWAAHAFEQSADNRLVRPLARYVGPDRRDLPG